MARSIKKRLQTFLIAIFALCYLASNVEFELFHAQLHQEPVATHNAEDEKDACHRKLFHHDNNAGCKHQSHVVASKKCGLCDHHFSHDKIAFDPAFNTVLISTDRPESFSRTSAAHAALPNLPARAPPVNHWNTTTLQTIPV